MISGKEFNMLFQLNAQLGGSYNSSFKSAQTAITSMQKEIQALSKTQSDISAFQKQQNATEVTRQKLVTLQQQYDNIQKEIKETEGYSSSLENKLISKHRQIDKTSSSLNEQTQKLNQMDVALRATGVDTGNLERESARLGNQMQELKGRQEEAAQGVQNFGASSVQAFNAVQQAIVSAGIALSLKEIYDAYMICVGAAGDFEASMSTVEALSGATGDEMLNLSTMAKELGATTKFTALESADAMGYMAMAGWDTADMLSGMDGVLQLASASGEDLAMVSDIVTDSLSAFGLTAADTAHFSDVLAAAATNSNTNVSIMGETFKMSASIAGALGYSIEDVAVAVGLMANSGVKGSIAGTALKNTFNGLLEGVTLTSNAFGEYEYSAIKADGTMKGFGATIDELRGYFDQMTEAERVSNAMTIAGARGYNGLLSILNATNEDYSSLTENINNCSGAAAKMAAIKLDNMNGQLTLMNSAWDALTTTLGEQFTPVMRDLYSVGTDVFGVLDGFAQQNPILVRAVAAFVAVLGTVVVGLTAYVAIAKIATVVSGLLSAAIPGVNVIMGVAVAVGAVTSAVVALSSAQSDEERELRSLTASSRTQYEELQALGKEYETAKERYGETSDEALSLRYEIDALTSTYQTNRQTVKELVAENDALMESHKETMATYSDNTSAIKDEEQGVLALVYKLKELSSKTALTKDEQEQMLAVVKGLNESIPSLALSYDEVTHSVNLTADAVESMARAQAQQELQAEKERAYIDLLKEEALLTNQLTEAKENLRLRQEELADAGYNIDAPFVWMATDISDIKVYEKEIERLSVAYNENEMALASLKDQQNSADDSSQALQSAIENTTAKMAALAESYTAAYTAAYESISGQYALWDEATAVTATGVDSINAALESQTTYWQNYNSNLQALSERSADIAGLSDVIATFADGSEDSVNAIAGMASASDAQLSAMVANWKNLQKEQAAASDSVAELKNDFTAILDALQTELATNIEAMDLSDEAIASGNATFQGFVSEAGEMLPKVREAYAEVADAARAALANMSSSLSGTITVTTRTITEKPDGTHADGLDYVPFDGYIAELHKGERVLTTEESQQYKAYEWQAFAAASRYEPGELEAVTFAPQFMATLSTIQGGKAMAAQALPVPTDAPSITLDFSPQYQLSNIANPEEMEAVLREHDENLRDYILDVLEEAGVDARRRAFL